MPITRSDMRSRVQRRIGDTAATSFYTTAFYNDIIETRTISRAGMIARLDPNYYMNHSSYIGVTDATDSTHEFYNFPSTFRAFVKLERQFGTGAGIIYQTVKQVNAEEQDSYKAGYNSVLALPDTLTNYQQTVSIWGTTFRLVPAPTNTSYLYRLKYLRRPATLSADESTLDVPDEWFEVIALDCSVFILTQTGDPLVVGLTKLRDEEIYNLSREYRRRNMGIEGMDTLRHWRSV